MSTTAGGSHEKKREKHEKQENGEGWNGSEVTGAIGETVTDVLKVGKELIQTHPVEAAVIGVGVGVLLGMLLSRRR